MELIINSPLLNLVDEELSYEDWVHSLLQKIFLVLIEFQQMLLNVKFYEGGAEAE